MLKHISIRNYALIEELEIDFFKGFSVITGETGSGKSIILGALNLIMGQRADSKTLMNWENKCIIEGFFAIDEYQLNAFFLENNLDFEPDHTILRREIHKNGKSRAFINDSPVKLNTLKELGTKIIDIHSQHDSLMLNKSNFQLGLIDQMAISHSSSHQSNLESFSLAFKKAKILNESLTLAKKNNIEAKEKLDYYNYLLEELKEVNLIENEKNQLESSIQIYENRENVLETLQKISFVLDNNHNTRPILPQLFDLHRDLEKISILNSDYKELSNRFSSILIELTDITKESDILASNVESQSINIQALNQRINMINLLEQKHQTNQFDDLFNKKAEIEKKVSSIIMMEDKVHDIKKEIVKVNSTLDRLVVKISKQRKKVLPSFQTHVEMQIQKMGIKNGKFKIQIEPRQIRNEWGADKVQFLFSGNKGISLEELNKVASGGETSRLMLSIKSLLTMHVKRPTLILDEIDVGVSGKIAGKMANLLQKMSINTQLIVISHLPQIAAKADYHYKVHKIDTSEKTETKIYSLDEKEKIEELTKMLSGEILSNAARENAKALRMNSQ
ncbi:MAG: DNA repair protein RecN [Flavobacteriales bacterium]|nr:DNA repair protein RecN [Flavobacteriales bacterium]|tara:strand:+ start:4080 stop:5765 length:1686 start_codon:yes stop_codon:yes gene_type:complete